MSWRGSRGIGRDRIALVAQAVKARTGGRLVAETLEALEIEVAFGVPGVHALAIWDGLRTSPIRTIGFRTELNAGFAADGYARATGKPAALLLSTGPGALISLGALMEAASSHVPLVAIASQIPRDLVGRGRGYLHELPDQIASFAPVVKWAASAESAAEVPELLTEAWTRARTPPSGPVFLEIPVDVLTAETGVAAPPAQDGFLFSMTSPAGSGQIAEAAQLLNDAERPIVWAGGGVLRSGAWTGLAELARRLGAPVATTYMGKGAFPADDPLSVGSGCDEGAFKELLADADVVLAVGTELGAETTAQYTLELAGKLVQIDAAGERIGATFPAFRLTGDAGWVLEELLKQIRDRDAGGVERAARVRERISAGLAEQDRALERALLETIRAAIPPETVTAWDMTILAYWAAAHFPVTEPRTFLYPLGSGTLGYAWPAALGAAVGTGTRTLAVVGDGGFLYGIQELATAQQYGLDTVVLVVDDGGYGILREYQRDSFGETTAVDLVEPDYVAVAEAVGVSAERTAPGDLGASLERAFGRSGPALIHLPVRLRMWDPTA
jgi:acetolactate synthase I/II/III large subunit